MDIANIIIAVLALIVAIIAILISVRQAKKSDEISLIGLRIEFYNYYCDFINRYFVLARIQEMATAKNADEVFGRNINKTVHIIVSALGREDLHKTFKHIIADINFLDINKYLFDLYIIKEIDEIIIKLKDFKTSLSNCANGKITERELQDSLKNLTNKIFDDNKEILSDKIKDFISIKHKI